MKHRFVSDWKKGCKLLGLLIASVFVYDAYRDIRYRELISPAMFLLWSLAGTLITFIIVASSGASNLPAKCGTPSGKSRTSHLG